MKAAATMGAMAGLLLSGSAAAGAPLTLRRDMATRDSIVITMPASTTFGAAQPLQRTAPFIPSVIPPDEVYYWTQGWQKGELETVEDFAAGRVRRFTNPDDAIMWLMSPLDD